MNKRLAWLATLVLVGFSTAALASEVGLVTSVVGKIKLQEPKSAAVELKPFIKLRAGDRLKLDGSSRLQLVFFSGGREESWQGAGTLEVGVDASQLMRGKSQVEVKTLPSILVKQLAKTPSPDGNVRSGMIRMRSLPPYDKLETVERTYADMRQQTQADDLNPELYLLASYLELREFDRLESALQRLNASPPGNSQVEVLTELYTNAVRQAQATR